MRYTIPYICSFQSLWETFWKSKILLLTDMVRKNVSKREKCVGQTVGNALNFLKPFFIAALGIPIWFFLRFYSICSLKFFTWLPKSYILAFSRQYSIFASRIRCWQGNHFTRVIVIFDRKKGNRKGKKEGK